MYQLVIGNKNYSSWSLRAWLVMTWSGLEFEEIRIPLFADDHWRDRLLKYSPAGRVPALLDGDITVWDSLAIVGHLQERHADDPALLGWPVDAAARAQARSITAEMHSGFLAIRDELPQNLRVHRPLDIEQLSENCRKQIRRVDELWCQAGRIGTGEGGYLYGARTIADAFFAPVALRFRTYDIPLSPAAAAYRERIAADGDVQRWLSDAEQEPESLAFIDERVPAADAPLVLG